MITKTVQDLDEAEFLANFHPYKTLEQIFGKDVRMARDGLVLTINRELKYFLKVGDQEPVEVSEADAYLCVLPIGIQYVAFEEAAEQLFILKDSVYSRISRLKKQLGNNPFSIRISNATKKYGGFYLGDLFEARPKHWEEWGGYRINTKTGCLIIPTGRQVVLSPAQTDIMSPIVQNRGKIANTDLAKITWQNYVQKIDTPPWFIIFRINQKVKDQCNITKNIIVGHRHKLHIGGYHLREF